MCAVDPSLATELAEQICAAGSLLAISGTGSTMSPGANLNEWLLMSLLVLTNSIEVSGGTWFHHGYFHDKALTPRAAPRSLPPDASGRPAMRFGQRPSAELVESIECGRVRALVTVGGNPLRALPETERVEAALRRLDVLAVVDVIGNELTDIATHVLPAPTQLERPDVNLPTELAQPIVVGQYSAALRRRADDVRSAWWWLAATGELMGRSILPGELDLDASDDQVLAAVAGEAMAALQDSSSGWIETERHPWIEHAMVARRWNLAPDELVEQWSRAIADVQRSRPKGVRTLMLVPLRQRRHVNATFMGVIEPVATLHQDDALAIGVEEAQTVDLVGPGGEVRLPVHIDDRLLPGTVGVPHGHASQQVNTLTHTDQRDRATSMPAFTAVEVEVRRAT